MKMLHNSTRPNVLGTSSKVLHQIAIITVDLYYPTTNGRGAIFLDNDRLSRKVELS